VDVANGAGLYALAPLLDDFPARLVNTSDWRKLNLECGSEYVEKMQKPPSQMPEDEHLQVACFDGDADRIVLAMPCPFTVLVGDRLSCLFALFLSDLITKIN
jgi:phosphomannomutase